MLKSRSIREINPRDNVHNLWWMFMTKCAIRCILLNHFFGGGIKFQCQIDITLLKTLEIPWRESQDKYESLYKLNTNYLTYFHSPPKQNKKEKKERA